MARLGSDLLRDELVDHDLIRADAGHGEIAPVAVRHRAHGVDISGIHANQPEGRLREPRVEVAHRDRLDQRAEHAVDARIFRIGAAQIIDHLLLHQRVRVGRER